MDSCKWLKQFVVVVLLVSICQCYELDESEVTIMSQSRNFSVFANETVQLPCLVKKQTPSTVVIWNQCEDPECNQVRNPLTVNKDNFIQDLRFRVLFQNLQDSIKEGEVKLDGVTKQFRSKFRYRDTDPNNSNYGDVNQWNLEIRKFSKQDEGCYQCQLNSFETKTIYYCIHLQKKVHASPKRETVAVGDKIQLKCMTDENVRMSAIKWYKNGHRLIENNHIQIHKHSADSFMHTHLLIQKAQMSDAGSYSCKFDQIHTNIEVNVVKENPDGRVESGLAPKSIKQTLDKSLFDSYKFFASSEESTYKISKLVCLLFVGVTYFFTSV